MRTRIRQLEAEKCRVPLSVPEDESITGEISGDPNESIVQSFTSFRPYTHVESGPRHKTPKEPHVFIIRYLAKPAASPPLLRFVVNLS